MIRYVLKWLNVSWWYDWTRSEMTCLYVKWIIKLRSKSTCAELIRANQEDWFNTLCNDLISYREIKWFVQIWNELFRIETIECVPQRCNIIWNGLTKLDTTWQNMKSFNRIRYDSAEREMIRPHSMRRNLKRQDVKRVIMMWSESIRCLHFMSAISF